MFQQHVFNENTLSKGNAIKLNVLSFFNRDVKLLLLM